MHPFTKVLVATDLSEAADEAMRQAAVVAGLYAAKLTVFHALPHAAASMPLFPQLGLQERSGFVALERRVLEALHHRTAEVLGRSTPVEVAIGSGSAHAAIVEHAEKTGSNLIVVGGEGPKGVARLVLGAVAERVVRHAHAPVWIARRGGGDGPVVIGTDFSASAAAATGLGLDFAKRTGAKVMLAHALSVAKLVPPPGPAVEQPAFPTWSMEDIETLREAARARLVATGLDAETVVNDDSPGVVLPELARQSKARLICVGTAGHTGLSRVLLGSVAEEVVRKASCPVLVTRKA